MTSQPTDELKECREAFEQWVTESGRPHLLKRYHGAWYEDLTVSAWWAAWHEAWNHRAPFEQAASGPSEPVSLPVVAYDVPVSSRDGCLAYASYYEAEGIPAPMGSKALTDHAQSTAEINRLRAALAAYEGNKD